MPRRVSSNEDEGIKFRHASPEEDKEVFAQVFKRSKREDMTPEEYVEDLQRRVAERKSIQGPPAPPKYKTYIPDHHRIVSGRNNVFERPPKEEITGLVAKCQLLFCRHCETETLQTMGPAMFGFHCVVNHRGKALCDCCDTYTTLAKVVLHVDTTYDSFCELCVSPDSPEKESAIRKRRFDAMREKVEPLSLNSSTSIARAFGASSFF